MQRDEYLRDFLGYAASFCGTPYIYGANGPDQFDCSGFINFALRKVGLVGLHEDLAAQGLYDKLYKEGTEVKVNSQYVYPSGTLLFYGKSKFDISHVAMVLDWYSVIECGGGNEKTTTIERARSLGAGVRERGIRLRSDIVAAVMPNFPWNGSLEGPKLVS